MANQQLVSQIILIVVLIAVFYFLLIWPQTRRQRQRKELIESIKIGDKIITVGGIFGQVKQLNEEVVMLEVSKNVTLELTKAAIAKKTTQESK